MQNPIKYVKNWFPAGNVIKYLSVLNRMLNYSCSSNIVLENVKPVQSGTMEEVRLKLYKRLGLDMSHVGVVKKRDHLLKYTPKQEELPPRSMKDSYMEAVIPLSVNRNMQVKYISPVGTVRLGRLMEDLDIFAVWICQQHILLPKLPDNVPLPYTFVTALVDKMKFSKLLPAYNQDIRLSGHISWVGRTSLEVSVCLEQKYENTFRQITHALFVIAARNVTNTEGAPVNPLTLDDEEEIAIFNLGQKRKELRKRLQDISIFKIKPTEEEHSIMYSIFQKTADHTLLKLNHRVLPDKSIWMNESFVTNTFLCFPENRNAYNNVFGGFLMRMSYEISWICAYMHCHCRPSCETCCDISFDKPIQIGSFIKMAAYIVYTENKHMQIMTVAELMDPKTNVSVTTNVFYYTFSCTENIIAVLPKTYHESIWYIHGRRKFYYAMEDKDVND